MSTVSTIATDADPNQLTITADAIPDGAYAEVERADDNAEPGWRALAMREIKAMAKSGMDFTSDQLRHRVPEADVPNRLGAVFMAASKAGIITAVGARPSEWPSCHGRLIRIWRGR